MNDKTAQSMTDELREATQADLAGLNGWGNLFSDAADTIDNLRAENESLREQRNRIGLCIGHALSGGRKDDHEAGLSERMNAIRALIAERNEWQASRIAYANEFPLNADGEPDVVNVHANIRSLKAQLAEAQGDAEVNKQINRACAELPDDCRIIIEIERNSTWVCLLKEGDDTDFDYPCKDVASTISAAIDAAKGETS